MYWHRVWYGNWNQPGGVRILEGSYNRKEIFERAQDFANSTGEVVTIEKVIPTGSGVRNEFFHIYPQPHN